jgi:hypothetical protein
MNRFVQSVSRSTMINRISSARVTALCAMSVFFYFSVIARALTSSDVTARAEGPWQSTAEGSNERRRRL